MLEFVHLHVHSHYSLLDGLPKIKDLVKAAKNRGFSALALTDHGTVSGVIEFYKACKEQEMKAIIGCEAYIAPVSMADKDSKYKYNHLVLLVENEEGYRNLMKLVTASYLEGYYYKPRMDKDLLRQYHQGLIASSACLGGEIARAILKENNYEKAKAVALEYQDIFGVGNFYLELMDLPDLEGQALVNAELIRLSKETGIPLIVTRDVHYINPEDTEAHDIITCIRDGVMVEEPNRNTMLDVNTSLASGADIAGRFSHIPEALANTVKIAERCQVKFEFGKYLIPAYQTPDNIDPVVYLKKLCWEGMIIKYKMNRTVGELESGNKEIFESWEQELIERLEYEFQVITEMGFIGYFLIVWDYVKWAKDNGIVVGPGRGSVAGSIVAYALDITEIDPLKYSLLFERFLNPARISMPDIDMDFADNRRDEVIEYVAEKYGRDRVAQICTFGTLAARAAVKDVGRALGASFNEMNIFAKLISDKPGTRLQEAIDASKEMQEIIKTSDKFKKITDNALKLEGMVRHMSVHACAVVIADLPLTHYTALQHPPKDDQGIITQFSAKPIEMLGLLKMDFLGLRNLTILQNAREIIEKTAGVKIDLKEISMEDKPTFDLLTRGETNSIFQLESSGMRRYLKELKPTEFEDIIAMVSLYRPGPMAFIPDYIAGKHGTKEVIYPHPSLEPILKKTYGIAIYQEQILQIAQTFSGFSLGAADLLRRAIGKKIQSELEAQRDKFIEGAIKNNHDKKLAISIFDDVIVPFAGYGFNKSHAACYAMIAYQTAYLKANYPIQYMTAVLIAESGNLDSVPAIISECERSGIKVLPPDVNQSFKNFAMVGWENGGIPHIRFGLQGIKNVGEHIAEVIYRERKNNGKYADLKDFLSRVKDKDLNKKSLESLIKCGALDCFGYDRGVLLFNLENLLFFSKSLIESANSKQTNLFAGTAVDLMKEIRLIPADQAIEADKIQWEKELLGVYITAHPCSKIEKLMKNTITALQDISQMPRSSWMVTVGVVDATKKKITKKGSLMMFVTIQDTSGSMELLVFPKTYEATKDLWVVGKVLCVVGKTSEEEGDDKLFVEKAFEVDENNASGLAAQMNMGQSYKMTDKNNQSSVINDEPVMTQKNETGLMIYLTTDEVKAKADNIKELLGKYPGESGVYLVIGDNKIKTSYKIKPEDELLNSLNILMGKDCCKLL